MSWKEVHTGYEADRIRRRRQVAFGFKPPQDPPVADPDNGHPRRRPDDLVGLALSGGGIRSALFNDGFLQALSHRGFLRFVDYLSSVSGGGYIAGHLTASGARYRDSDPATSFHDDEGCYRMGKDPRTGELDAGRIAHAGGYLERNIRLWFRYIAAWAFNFMLFAGGIGAVSALLAICWRSLDRPAFREQVALLDLDSGGDLAYALLPWLAVTLIWLLSVFSQVALGLVYYLLARPDETNRRNPFESHKWNLLNSRLGIASALFAAIGLAIFLGNSWTRIGRSAEFHLNHYAQWLAIIAVVLQIVAFFGGKQLFHSERPEASNLQKTLQVIVANGVVGVAVFAMLHWMGRENISGYTRSRAPDLERTDVQDWPAFIAFCNARETYLSEEIPATVSLLKGDLQAWLEAEHPSKAKGEWRNFQFQQIVGLRATPTTEDQGPSAPSSIDQNKVCYSGLPWRAFMVASCSLGSVCEEWWKGSDSFFESMSHDLTTSMDLRRQTWRQQSKLARQFNDGGLASPKLAHSLLDSIAKLVIESRLNGSANFSAQPRRNDRPTYFESHYGIHADKLQEWIRQREGEDHWSPDQMAKFQLDCQWLSDVSRPDDPTINAIHRERLIQFTRTLLDLVHPDLLYQTDACRTAAIMEYDQAARWRWFYLFMVGACIGYVGSLNLNRHSPLYTFYRHRLAKNFLTGWIGKKAPAVAARKEDDFLPLDASDPTDVGLPYPLMLGAVLDLDHSPEPFLFTPEYLGVTQGEHESVIKTSGWRIPGATGFVKLVDAVAISGSALAPLMTKNKALRTLFSFFNLRLGQWICLPNRSGVTSAQPRFWGYLSALHVEASSGQKGPRDNTNRPDWSFRFAADGGFVDYLGVYELLERRCKLIVVSDSGSNIGRNQLGTLARMLEESSTRLGVRFVDLDHEAPIDFERLSQNDKRTVPQTFICMRVRYPDKGQSDVPDEAYLIYVQMAITDSDPIEIRQIRKRFPVFPDEPTVNQFYAEEQVAAYRQLGYHIGKRLCGELDRWTSVEIQRSLRNDLVAIDNLEPRETSIHDPYYGLDQLADQPVEWEGLGVSAYETGQKPPLLSTVIRRLLAGYRMACFQEISYKAGDIYAEAIWDRGEWCFASFANSAVLLKPLLSERNKARLPLAMRLSRMRKVANAWLEAIEQNADVRAAYRRAVFFDLNSSIVSLYRSKPYVNYEVFSMLCEAATGRRPDEFERTSFHKLMGRFDWHEAELAVAHLCAVAFTCHQLRRGTPQSVFQIGGRDKLIDLIISMVLGERPEVEGGFKWPDWAKGACPEVIEMKRCVFQGAEAETTASFAYVMALFAAKLVKADRTSTPQVEIYSRIQKAITFDRIQLLPTLITQVLRPEDNDPLNQEGAWAAFNTDLVDRDGKPPIKVTILNDLVRTQEVPARSDG